MILTFSGIDVRTMVTVRVNSLVYIEGPVGYVNSTITSRVKSHKFAIPSDQLDHVDIELGELMAEDVYHKLMQELRKEEVWQG